MAALADAEWGAWSDGKVAELCKVSDMTVAAVRKEQAPQVRKSGGGTLGKPRAGIGVLPGPPTPGPHRTQANTWGSVTLWTR